MTENRIEVNGMRMWAHHGCMDEEAIIGQPVLDLYDTLYQDLCTTHKSNILEHAEREIIVRALEATEGKLVKAAGILGITTATLRKRMDRYDLLKMPG